MKQKIKVFRMDDYDWVAAYTQEEAKEFYLKETGVDEDELDIKECSLERDGMYTEISLEKAQELLAKLSAGYKVNNRRTLKFAYGDVGLAMWRSYAEVIEEDNITEPCIVASTEW